MHELRQSQVDKGLEAPARLLVAKTLKLPIPDEDMGVEDSTSAGIHRSHLPPKKAPGSETRCSRLLQEERA